MTIIHILPEHVANKISAGEVVERPASIIKELVENSLDAGAKTIEVSVKHGGKSFIRVSDDGCGMGSEDARLAIQRFATSKISKAEDLAEIGSYGFRGEALPSIAAVSRMKLVTRAKGDSNGTEIVIEGGTIVSETECSCREGTIIEVRDLFYNTPVRRKFMRAESTEMGYMIDAVSYLALANPKVRFSFISGERKVLDLIPVEKSFERASAVFNEEEVKHLIEFDGGTEGIRLSGFVGKPAVARANRQGQIFFVNGRWVKSVAFGFALQEGCHGLLMHGQFAIGVLFLDIDRSRVDVNVHPTKQEVRISADSEIKSFIRKVVTERLQRESDLATLLKMMTPRVPGTGIAPYIYPEFLKTGGTSTAQIAEHAEVGAGFSARGGSADLCGGKPALTSPEFAVEPIAIKDKFHITKILGQIHQTYIIAETEEGLIIIDQHAAHERVMFELLFKDMKEGKPKSQGLLMDEILEVRPKQREVLEEAIPFLEKLGFRIDSFGENSFVIRAYPAVLELENPVQFLKQFVEEKEDGQIRTNMDNCQEELVALVACKRRSVKANEALTFEGMRTLLTRLSGCENPFHCPHGRPTFLKYTVNELEKQFKRK